MELKQLRNERMGIVEDGQIIAFISDRSEIILQSSYLDLGFKKIDLFWNLVNFIRGDDTCLR